MGAINNYITQPAHTGTVHGKSEHIITLLIMSMPNRVTKKITMYSFKWELLENFAAHFEITWKIRAYYKTGSDQMTWDRYWR